MRIGEWVPVFKQWLPIPQRMAMAFGLQEGSELYLARVEDTQRPDAYEYEIIVSPVPAQSWRSVCRLSVRLEDAPKALATATRFLRDRKINILLTECCTTYRRRAHWDAICDLVNMTEFQEELKGVERDPYEGKMRNFLREKLTEDLKTFARDPDNRDAFLKGGDELIEFTPLTGLNDAHFMCDTDNVTTLTHQAGAIRLPDEIASDLRDRLLTRPDYAIVTGNTEQRYIRVLFMRDYEHIFQARVENNLQGFAGGGVGVLNQILDALPDKVNLIRAANYIVTKNKQSERGRIELIGYWPLDDVEPPDKRAYMERELKNRLESKELKDVDGEVHREALTVLDDFVTPPAVYPRVFVSYSSRGAENQLQSLLSKLLANSFEPVLGAEPRPGRLPPAGDGSDISGCVAFISLQLRREDYKVTVATTGETRYVLPPWATAEEAFARAKGVPFLIRLKDAALETYDSDVKTIPFTDKYEYAVNKVITELKNFRASDDFPELNADARARQFEADRDRTSR